MLLSPFRHLIDDGEEPLAVLRLTVFHPWRIAVALMTLYQAIVHHLPQPLRQHLLADTVNSLLNVLETSVAVEDSRQHLYRPLAPQYVHRVLD